jgi:hypothetical protein
MDSVTGARMGMMKATGYPVTIAALPPVCALPAFTDGLVKRKGQLIDTGFAQPWQAVSRDGQPLSQLSAGLVSTSTPRGSDDDSAILGMRWTD